jgi:hypothetical protein
MADVTWVSTEAWVAAIMASPMFPCPAAADAAWLLAELCAFCSWSTALRMLFEKPSWADPAAEVDEVPAVAPAPALGGDGGVGGIGGIIPFNSPG